mgnify:CR=1 FL=1
MISPFGNHSPLVRRVDDLLAKKLTTNEIVILCQDLIDSGTVVNWGQNVYDVVVHCLNQRLCTLTEAYKQ